MELFNVVRLEVHQQYETDKECIYSCEASNCGDEGDLNELFTMAADQALRELGLPHFKPEHILRFSVESVANE